MFLAPTGSAPTWGVHPCSEEVHVGDLALGRLLQPGIEGLGGVLQPEGEQLLAGALDGQHQRSPVKSAS